MPGRLQTIAEVEFRSLSDDNLIDLGSNTLDLIIPVISIEILLKLCSRPALEPTGTANPFEMIGYLARDDRRALECCPKLIGNEPNHKLLINDYICRAIGPLIRQGVLERFLYMKWINTSAAILTPRSISSSGSGVDLMWASCNRIASFTQSSH